MSDLGSSVSSFNSSVSGWFGSVFNSLSNFSSTFTNWIAGLMGKLADLFGSLFSPQPGYIEGKMQTLQDDYNSKFAWVQVLKNLIPTSIDDVVSFRIPFLMGTYIDFGWFDGYRAYVHGIISAAFWILTFFNIIKKIRVKIVLNG